MSTVRLLVTRTGGVANVRLTVEVDDPDEAERLSEEVRRSAEREADRRARDDFAYEFRIETTTTTWTVDLSRSQLTGELRPQVDALLADARRRP